MPSPNAITPTSSYSYGSGYVPSGPPLLQPQQLQPRQRVPSSHSRPALIPTGAVDALASQFSQKALLTKTPRRRTTSQPTLPAGHTYVQTNDAAHTGHTHGYVQDPRNPDFRYSTCSGRRKAVCIGVNYLGQQHELRGCINDAKHVRRFLIDHGGYRSRDIYLLTDDATDPQFLPTRSNMLKAMRWLVKDARQNDALFFHYSGHGGQTRDRDGDEIDGFDEVIYPMDFKTTGHIVDDELHDIMVKRLPQGCRLTNFPKACHSGTVLGMWRVHYSSHGRLKGMHISANHWEKKATAADVISWSGCLDDQTSADTFQEGMPVGAMSYHILICGMKMIENRPEQTYQEFLSSLRKILNPRYSQKPQLGSSHKIVRHVPLFLYSCRAVLPTAGHQSSIHILIE
ncbi:hypothetical protein HYPSUDRAFT_149011 [Hypholoma sublateritium FD-334 SS-4]|uniref:Peptidase C14 caspase domain-containing protein n=1 Tax=Hypholoma sublateritium (strain FD-334 SS-4) TaxID=945553 RepID=A0A0D2LXC6_HYPSF|nr:hypothetical protein HYPSUDRAFT_149011 [Hypholoma sublateritium FD-334 SS-4]